MTKTLYIRSEKQRKWNREKERVKLVHNASSSLSHRSASVFFNFPTGQLWSGDALLWVSDAPASELSFLLFFSFSHMPCLWVLLPWQGPSFWGAFPNELLEAKTPQECNCFVSLKQCRSINSAQGPTHFTSAAAAAQQRLACVLKIN